MEEKMLLLYDYYSQGCISSLRGTLNLVLSKSKMLCGSYLQITSNVQELFLNVFMLIL